MKFKTKMYAVLQFGEGYDPPLTTAQSILTTFPDTLSSIDTEALLDMGVIEVADNAELRTKVEEHLATHAPGLELKNFRAGDYWIIPPNQAKWYGYFNLTTGGDPIEIPSASNMGTVRLMLDMELV